PVCTNGIQIHRKKTLEQVDNNVTTSYRQWRAVRAYQPNCHAKGGWLSLEPENDDPGDLSWLRHSPIHATRASTVLVCPEFGSEDVHAAREALLFSSPGEIRLYKG